MINALILSKEKRREAMPETAAIYLEYREEFGAGVTIKATEKGYFFSYPQTGNLQNIKVEDDLGGPLNLLHSAESTQPKDAK